MHARTHTLALICLLLALPACEPKSNANGSNESDERQQSLSMDGGATTQTGVEAIPDETQIAGYLTDGEWIGPELWAVNTKPWVLEVGDSRKEMSHRFGHEARYEFRANDTGEVSYTFEVVTEMSLSGPSGVVATPEVAMQVDVKETFEWKNADDSLNFVPVDAGYRPGEIRFDGLSAAEFSQRENVDEEAVSKVADALRPAQTAAVSGLQKQYDQMLKGQTLTFPITDASESEVTLETTDKPGLRYILRKRK